MICSKSYTLFLIFSAIDLTNSLEYRGIVWNEIFHGRFLPLVIVRFSKRL